MFCEIMGVQWVLFTYQTYCKYWFKGKLLQKNVFFNAPQIPFEKNVCIMCIYIVLKEKLLYKYVCFLVLFYTQVQEGNAFYKYGDIIQFQ
jgi:hypothetical protein